MEHTLTVNDGTLAWDDVGPQDASQVVVLLHGFPHDRTLWRFQIEQRAAAFPQVRLLIPDLPGFGRSTALENPSMDGFADSIASLLDAAGVERAVIAGLSMGGYIAFAFWRKHASRVRALILIDTKADPDTESGRASRRALITTVECDGVVVAVAGMLEQQLGATTRADRPALADAVAEMLRRAPARGVIGAAQALMNRPSSTETLSTVTVPTLVLVGIEDTLTPPTDAFAMAAALPRSRLVTIADAGHLAPLEQPATVNAAIAEFLEVALGE